MIAAALYLVSLVAILAMLVEGRGHARGPVALLTLLCLATCGAVLAVEQLV